MIIGMMMSITRETTTNNGDMSELREDAGTGEGRSVVLKFISGRGIFGQGTNLIMYY